MRAATLLLVVGVVSGAPGCLELGRHLPCVHDAGGVQESGMAPLWEAYLETDSWTREAAWAADAECGPRPAEREGGRLGPRLAAGAEENVTAVLHHRYVEHNALGGAGTWKVRLNATGPLTVVDGPLERTLESPNGETRFAWRVRAEGAGHPRVLLEVLRPDAEAYESVGGLTYETAEQGPGLSARRA